MEQQPPDIYRGKDPREVKAGTSRTQFPPRPKHKNETAGRTHDPYEGWKTLVAVAALVVSGLALAVSFFSCSAAQRSATAGEKSADAAVKSADAVQQNAAIAKQTFIPRMIVLGITPGSLIQRDAEIPLNFLWRNDGGSSALRVNLQGRAGICVGKRDISCLKIDPFPAPPPEESRGMGDVYTKEAAFSTVRLPPQSQEVIEALRRGDQTIYLYGVFHYKDSVETRYECEFCYFYMLDQQRTPMRCPTHNRCEEHQPEGFQ
jgi:hypothetical protein